LSTATNQSIRPPFGGPASDAADAYSTCQVITKAGAKNFYYAFLTLPKEKRQAIYAAYAFCRITDDISDDLVGEERESGLADLRKALDSAYSNSPDGAVFIALEDAANQYQIPKSYFEDVITGVEMDISKNRYETFEELREYCYHVASVVGLICVEVFGYSDDRAVESAIVLGIAMQLTNIMRDVGEDAERGRIYLPLEDLRKFEYTEEQLLAGEWNENFHELMKFEAERARNYFFRGTYLFNLLDRRSRACPETLASVYSKILGKMEREKFPVFEKRVGISKFSKIAMVARLWIKSRVPLLG